MKNEHRNNEQPIGRGFGPTTKRRSKDGVWTHELKKKKAMQLPEVESHKRIWHPVSQTGGESCCAEAIMKFSLGQEIEEASSQRRMRTLTSWLQGPRQSLWGGGGKVGPLIFLFILILGMMAQNVGGTEDWTLQCPIGCKCTWVSGKKTADCRASQFSAIPTGLSPEVQVLEMGGNTCTIKLLPKDAFKSVGLVNLQKVFLQNCRIERIDSNAFRDLTIMIELDLSGNLVSSIEMETFESNVRLRELKLSKNPLSKLTGLSFPPLMYLKLLDLSDCQLSTLPRRAFEKLSVLETLSLSGNRFTFLSKELLKPLIKLKSLLLSGNPWKCDCRLKSLRDWVIEKNLFQHHTRCAEPAIVSNFAWDQLVSPDFACRPEIVSVQINGKSTPALLVHTEVGSDITLQCLVRGNPPPELKWVRDGQVLTNTSRYQGKFYYLYIGEEGWDAESDSANTEYRGRWVNLTIQKTDPEDAGEYTCVGSNSGGVVEKNLTLNFNDVPSGAGVGHGLGGLGGGSYRDTGWIWILIITIAVLVLATALISVACLCSKRRRVKTTRGQDIKSDAKLNGSVAGYSECPKSKSKLDPGQGKLRDSPTTNSASPRFSGDPSTLQHFKNCSPTGNSPSATTYHQHHQQSQTHPQHLCPTSSLAQSRHGKSVTVPCSADVELTYRINPLHCTNPSLGANSGMGTYSRRQQLPVRCTFQRDQQDGLTNCSAANPPQQSSTGAYCEPTFHHEMIELSLHPKNQAGSPSSSRIGVLESVESSSSSGMYFHHPSYPGAEVVLVSQSTSPGDGKDVLPPPPQYAISPTTNNGRNCGPSCCQQYEHPSPSCCAGYHAQNHVHHNHHHQNPYATGETTRFESDNLVVMTRTPSTQSTECQIPSPPASVGPQIIPVHSFCGSNYASISRGLPIRLPERVPPPPPQRDLTTYATLSCSYSPVSGGPNGSNSYGKNYCGDPHKNHLSSSQQQSPSGSSSTSSYNTRLYEQQSQQRDENLVKCDQGEGEREDQPHQRQLLLTPTSGQGSEKLDDDGTAMLLMKEKYFVGPDRSRSQSADILSPYNTENGSLYNHQRPSSAIQMVPTPPPPSSSLTGAPHHGGIHHPGSGEYPDLLDLPHTRFADSPAPSSTVSTLPDSTRMLITPHPHQLNPAILVNPSRLGYNNHPQSIYSSGGRPMSPFGLPFSPGEPALVPPGTRPGYVTLPRRHRVPSWSPSAASPMGPPSPTGSAATISLPFVKARPKYSNLGDNLGPRTTADGSSRLSLNNLPETPGSTPSTPNSFHHPLMGGTLGRHHNLRSTPTQSILGQPISHFAPIQEVEPLTSPIAEVEPEPDGDNNNGFGNKRNIPKPNKKVKPVKTETSPRGSGAASPSKKVPPKPPPKPGKKKGGPVTESEEQNGRLSSTGESPFINEPTAAILGDDGTEV